MKKVLLVFGTRPEAIKMAPVHRALRSRGDAFDVRVCVTGQHRQMLDQVMDIFGIKADFDLNIMKPAQTLFDVTSAVLLGMRGVLEEAKPDLVLVQGDTTTVLAGALAAYYLRIPVGHVEAGLRTGDKFSPFPEEINRRLTASLSDYHFAPTSKSAGNLLAEGIQPSNVYVTGNTVIDALFWASEIIQDKTTGDFPELAGLDLRQRVILVTGHRRENFGEGFLNICNAIKQLAVANPDVQIIYPVHLNPNVQQPVRAILGDLPNVNLRAPLSYLPFVFLMKHSYLVLTDSGGVQEEAPSLGKPVLVMRNTTERPEALEAGTVRLVATDADNIVRNAQQLLDDGDAYRRMSQAQNPYGDGLASQRIADIIAGRPWQPFAPHK